MRLGLAFLALILAGCGGTRYVKDYEVGTDRYVVVGSTMLMEREEYYDPYGRVYKGFEKRLVYAGLQGPNVVIDYKESSSGYARPAFDQRTLHNLAKGREIVIRDVRILVKEADGKGIRFRVLETDVAERVDYGEPEEASKGSTTSKPK